jgi:sarcosine oxidase gamma subunit
VERMRARLGAGWDPATAVLLWTASQAADDRTPNAALSNPNYYEVSSADDRYGWKPAAEVRAGSGQGAAVTQVAGGSFYVRVKGARSETTLSAASSTPDARWMIVRVR